MNIALSTLAILIFSLPGLAFRRTYFSAEFSKEYFKQSINEFLFSIIFPSLIIHSIGFFIVPLWGFTFDFEKIGYFFYNAKDINPIGSIESDIKWILLYNAVSISFAFLLGYISKQIVRGLKLDIHLKLLRFQNNWHYITSGEFFLFKRNTYKLRNDKVEDIEIVYVDALVETSDGPVIYDGILVDYELSKSGALELIMLKQVQRRFLSMDKESNSSDEKEKSGVYYDIPGHVLTLQYDRVMNLNFSYYKFDIKKFDNEQLQVEIKMIS